MKRATRRCCPGALRTASGTVVWGCHCGGRQSVHDGPAPPAACCRRIVGIAIIVLCVARSSPYNRYVLRALAAFKRTGKDRRLTKNGQPRRKVTIDMGEMSARRDDRHQNVRHDEFIRVLSKILEPTPAASEYDDGRRSRPLQLDVMPYRQHNTIMVSARRGDGKTTFLADLLHYVEKLQTGPMPLEGSGIEIPPDKAARLYSLGIVDPTLIESKQNIVILIVQKIEAAVNRWFDARRPDAGSERKRVNERLRELADGMSLLDGIGTEAYGKDWADPDYILDRGMDRADSAGGFERAFHRYVEEACRFLERDAFVLAIDDVDTWFARGWTVLEALRKYLTTPKLRIVLAGDIRLYNLLVRSQQWEQMTPAFLHAERSLDKDRSHLDQIAVMVDTLQDQYMIKVAPPENRVVLRPLYHTMELCDVFLRSSVADGEIVSEKTFFEAFARELIAVRLADDRQRIRQTVLKLPFRSSLQAMTGAWGLVSTARSPLGGDDHRQLALDALRHVSSAHLMGLDIDEGDLREGDPDRLFGVLSSWLTERRQWKNAPRFHPDGHDDRGDLVALFVAAILVDLFRRSAGSMINYWVRLCTVREMVDRSDIAPERIGDLVEHLKATTSQDAVQFASRLAAWQAEGGRQLARGIRLEGVSVPVSRLKVPEAVRLELYGADKESFRELDFVRASGASARRSAIGSLPAPLQTYHRKLVDSEWPYRTGRGAESGLIGSYANSLESLADTLTGQAAMVALLPALKVTSGQQSDNGSYSFIRLLAFVGNLMDLMGSDVSEAEIAELLSRQSQLRSYPTPFATGLNQVEEDAEYYIEEDDRPDDGRSFNNNDVSRMLLRWVESLKEHGIEPVAPVSLARSWTRFTYAFASIRDDLKHTKTRYLGVLMHRTIVAFLHAVGVEALRSSGGTLTPTVVNNPIGTAIPFHGLLQEVFSQDVDRRDPSLSLFLALFSCPIWGYFLARGDAAILGPARKGGLTDEVFDIYRSFVQERLNEEPVFTMHFRNKGSKKDDIAFDGLYDILNTVQIQGQQARSRSRGEARKRERTVTTDVKSTASQLDPSTKS